MQPNRDSLATYTPTARRVDLASVFAFAVLALFATVRLITADGSGLSVVAVVVGYLAADVGTGFVHWLFDTWFRVATPLVGQVFVRTFREHHVDPLAITRHDFVETNGSNCLATLPVLVTALIVPAKTPSWHALSTWLVTLAVGVFLTNQFHQWAHMRDAPRVARVLYGLRLILSPEHHARHHAAPFDTHYCITTGWMNGPLDRLGAFRAAEALIQRISGIGPRAEDTLLADGIAPVGRLDDSSAPADASRPARRSR